MDFSPLFDPEYLPIIVGTIVGFGLLAAVLLVPVYRFLEREKEVAEKWTPEALAKRMRERQEANGTETETADDASAASNGTGDSSNSSV